jgi:hypothetical protein
MMEIILSRLSILPSLNSKHCSDIEKGLQDGKEDNVGVFWQETGNYSIGK